VSGSDVVIMVIATGLGACVQGSIGFGLGLVAAPVLALIDPSMVPGPVLAAGVPLTLAVLVRERKALDIRALRWALGGRIAGTVMAAATLAVLPERPLGILFALLVLTAVVLSVAGWYVRPRPRTLAAAGVASGFMGTATSIGGPPIALLFQRSRGSELRATVGVVLAFGAVLSLASLIAVGRFGWDELRLTLLLVPGVAVGYLVSGPLSRVLDRGWLRPAVLLFAAASAIVLLVDQVVG
jgi:uncharacterized membrane protein YfcA